jgi:hypothetical protein
MADRHSWTVTGMATDQTVNTPANQTVVGVYVYFRTGDGNHGAVFVPNDKFTHENVRVTVQQEAKKIDLVGRLSEGMG